MNRKGMIAMMDAMIFVMLITLVSLMILDFDGAEEDYTPLNASEVCEYVLSTDVGGSGMIPDMGDSEYRMVDALAFATVDGSEKVFGELETMIQGLTMGKYDYRIRFACNGHVKEMGEGNWFAGSSYSGSWTVIGGTTLDVEMWLS